MDKRVEQYLSDRAKAKTAWEASRKEFIAARAKTAAARKEYEAFRIPREAREGKKKKSK